LFLFDVVSHIPEIHLDAGGGNHDLMFVLVADLSAAQSEIVVTAKLDDIRKEVIALDDKVLDDGINHRVRNFNARNGDVASALEGTRDDDIREILDQMRLEGYFAILAGAKILE